MSTDLRVDKSPLKITFRDVLSTEEDAEIFVSESESFVGGEKLSDLLTARKFVPVKEAQSIRFMNPERLLWVRLALVDALSEVDPEVEDAEGSTGMSVSLVLSDGSSLEGSVRYFLPPEACRLSDYLEGAPKFFPIRTTDWLFLVNRSQVVRLVPREENKG